MNSVMTLNWLEMRRLTSSRARREEDAEIRSVRLARENASLTRENTRLRAEYEDLAASALTWIRLYEAALDRANQATGTSSGLAQPAAR